MCKFRNNVQKMCIDLVGGRPVIFTLQALEDMKQENIAKRYNLVQKAREIGMKLDDIAKESKLLGKSPG